MPTPHRASPIPHTAMFDLYHLPPAFFFYCFAALLCLWGVKARFMWLSGGKKSRRVSVVFTSSCKTLNPVLQGVVTHCSCRFTKHALHRAKVEGLLHFLRIPVSIINGMHLFFHSFYLKENNKNKRKVKEERNTCYAFKRHMAHQKTRTKHWKNRRVSV